MIFSGDDDPLTPSYHARSYFNKLNCKDKTLKVIKNGKHELFYDYCAEDIWKDKLKWIEERLENA